MKKIKNSIHRTFIFYLKPHETAGHSFFKPILDSYSLNFLQLGKIKRIDLLQSDFLCGDTPRGAQGAPSCVALGIEIVSTIVTLNPMFSPSFAKFHMDG